MGTPTRSHEARGHRVYPQLAKWTWRPWYAKLWWSTIPCWWLGMFGSAYFEVLEKFYHSTFAGFINVFFFPPVAFMLLGIGFIRELLDRPIDSADESWLIDYEEQPPMNWHPDTHLDFLKDISARGNPMNPRAGPLWIGNRENPSNPSYIAPPPSNPSGY